MIQYIKRLGFLLTIAVFAAQCSQKTTESTVQEAADEMMVEKETFRNSAPAAAPAPKIQIGQAETFDLDNGLKVIVVENDKIPQVSYQISLINEPILEGEKVGYVSMAGDILSRGTASKTKAEIDEAVDFIGASMNTYGSGMFGSSLTKHSDKLLDIMTDVLYNPAFPQEELDKIKTQTISNIESSKTDPNAMISNVRASVNYGGDHPYGEIQTKSDVENIEVADLKRYYDNFFVPNNAYLIVVGDIDIATAKKNAEQYFGKWKRKAVKPSSKRSVPDIAGTNVKFAHKDAAVQSIINVTYPIDLKPGEPDVIPASVMNTILGGGFSSRLMQNLREDKAYTYGSRSSLSSNPVVGNFTASASVRNEVTDSSVTEFLYELNRIATSPVEDKELQSIKNYMTGGFARSLESPQTIARFAYNKFRYNLPDDYYETYLQKLNAVTKEDVMEMAKKYIRPERANIVIVGNKDEVAESLVKFDADGEIEYFDAFGEKIEYRSVDLPDDVTAGSIVTDYIDAIGGAAAINGVASMSTVMKANAMGQELTISSYQMDGKFAMDFGMAGMVMQSQVFDGTKGKMSAQGQEQIITEGPMFDDLKAGAKLVAQLDYNSDGTTLEVAGIEDIEGTTAYKLMVTTPSGKKITEFYGVDNGLLIRTVNSPAEGQTITTDFMDYKQVDGGFMIPYTTKVSGMMPIPLEMKVAEVEVNGEIPAEKFKID